MAYLVLVVLTVISCILFEYSGISKIVNNLMTAYRQQFAVMSDKSLKDEEKQKQLMNLIPRQLLLMGMLILGILLFIAPFFSLFLLNFMDEDLNPDILVTWWGIVIPIITVLFYIYTKRFYGNLQRNR